MTLMMFKASFTLWHGGKNKPESKEYRYRQACYSLGQFSTSLEQHVENEYGGIIRTVEIENEGTT